MAAHASNFFQAVKDIVRLLTFRLTSEGFARFGWHHLAIGLLFTWRGGRVHLAVGEAHGSRAKDFCRVSGN